MIRQDKFIVHKLLLRIQSDPIRKPSRAPPCRPNMVTMAPLDRGGDGRTAKLNGSKRQHNCSSPSAAGSVPRLLQTTSGDRKVCCFHSGQLRH